MAWYQHEGMKLGTLAGVPVRITPGAVLALALSIPFGGVRWASAFCIAFFVHELGPGLLARRFGLKPQIVLRVFGGSTSHARPSGRQNLALAVAGWSANLAIGGALYGAALRVSPNGQMGAVSELLFSLWRANLAWAVFQLLPAWPLDGFRVVSTVLGRSLAPTRARAVTLKLGISACAVGAVAAFFTFDQPIVAVLAGVYTFINYQRLLENPARHRSERYPRRLFADARRAVEAGDFREARRLGHLIRSETYLSERLRRDTWLLLARAELELGDFEECLADLRYAGECAEATALEAECERRRREAAAPQPQGAEESDG